MTRLRGALLVVCCFLSVVAASLTSTATADVGSTKTATIKAAHLGLKYPSNWTVFILTPKLVAEQRKVLAAKNPDLVSGFDLQQQVEAARHTKFNAGDLEAKLAGRPASDVGVTVASEFSPSLKDGYIDGLVTAFTKQGITVARQAEVRVSGAKSYRLDLRFTLKMPDGTPISGRESMLIVPRGRGGALVMVATTDDVTGATLIDTILGSVRRI